MKWITIAVLFIAVSGFAQKPYTFDYLARFEYKVDEKAAVQERFLLTNSLDGSYAMFVVPKPDGILHLFVSDVNGLIGIADMQRADFFKAETITLQSDQIMARDQEYDKTDDYDLTRIADTLVAKTALPRFMLKSNDLDKEIKKKLATAYYIMEDGTDFQAPIGALSSFFDVWVLSENTPRGIPKIMYLEPFDKKKTNFIYELKEIAKVTKNVALPKGIEIVKSGNTIKIIRK